MLFFYAVATASATALSLLSIKRFTETRKKQSVESETQQQLSQYLNIYIDAERKYDAIKSEFAVKSRFYQQTPVTVRGEYSDEMMVLQAQLEAQKHRYFEAKRNYLSLGKALV